MNNSNWILRPWIRENPAHKCIDCFCKNFSSSIRIFWNALYTRNGTNLRGSRKIVECQETLDSWHYFPTVFRLLSLVVFLYRAEWVQWTSYRRAVKAQIALNRREDSRDTNPTGLSRRHSVDLRSTSHPFKIRINYDVVIKGIHTFISKPRNRAINARLLKFIGSPVASFPLPRHSSFFPSSFVVFF